MVQFGIYFSLLSIMVCVIQTSYYCVDGIFAVNKDKSMFTEQNYNGNADIPIITKQVYQN